jgi:hypothetical protein
MAPYFRRLVATLALAGTSAALAVSVGDPVQDTVVLGAEAEQVRRLEVREVLGVQAMLSW